jgi:nucleotide-binding universal stress UspA family protein
MGETEGAAVAKARRRKQQERIFLVVVDNSEEMRLALRYACLRAKATGGRVALFTAIEPAESHSWQAVGELMEEEQRVEAEAMMQRYAEEVVKLSGKTPVIYIRQGVARDALLRLIDEEPTISTLILATGTGRGGPGPLISALTGKFYQRVNIPLTLVPGTLTDEEIDALT